MAVGLRQPSTKPRFELTRPVFLVGFMGAGKSSVARKLARMCQVSSLDLDTYIERSAGKAVNDIFAEVGETGFRAIETEALKTVAFKRDPMLVSCGGGIVCQAENRSVLTQGGFVIHLRVDALEASKRISDTSTRPLFNDLAEADERCTTRMPLYEEVADATVDTIGKNVYQIAKEVQRILTKEGVLCQR